MRSGITSGANEGQNTLAGMCQYDKNHRELKYHFYFLTAAFSIALLTTPDYPRLSD